MSRPLDRFFAARDPKSRRPRRLPLVRSTGRLRGLLIFVAVIFSIAAGRAVQVQAIDATDMAEEAADQMTVSHDLPAFRGTITDRNGEVLAQTQDTVRIIADARMIRTNGRGDAPLSEADQAFAAAAPAKIAAILVRYLGGTTQDYLPRLTATGKGESYQPVGDQIAAATFRKIVTDMRAQDLVGLSSESQPTRVYPNASLAANVIGSVNSENVGASGLEYALNSQLSGKDGKEAYENSPNGKIPLGESALVEPINGRDVQLTIDSGMQWQLDQILGDRVRKANAQRGSAIVVNVKSGEVLGLSQYPTFDPNEAGKADQDNLPLRAITDPYTPGSVQKVLTLAALMDLGLTTPNDVVTVPSKIKSGDSYITDAVSHGKMKLYTRGILAKSSNIGTILLARRAEKADLHDYYSSYGLGKKTGFGGLAGESAGSLPGADMADYTRDGLAFGGSAVGVTMVQEAAAVAGIANGGVYHPLRLIKSETLPDGSQQEPKLAEPHRVISAETSTNIVSMMETMAQQTTSHTFDVTGYRVGAKTGTSKEYNSKCNCFSGLVTSAISVAPVEDPQILVYVVVSNPKRGSYGGSVAGPAVQDAMSVALARYGVPQTTGKVPRLAVAPKK